MPEPTRSTLADTVARAWLSGRAPSLRELVLHAQAPVPGDLAEAVAQDCDQRTDRSLPAGLDHYVRELPPSLLTPEVIRAILMVHFSRSEHDIGDLRAELASRWPEYRGEIDAAAELATLMRSAVEQSPLPPALSPGLALGKYRLVEWLGAGSFGEVWSAWDTRLERYVALKLLPPEGVEHSMLAAVIREAKAAACIDHENVVRVHDAGRIDEQGRCYIDAQLAGDPSPCPQDAKRVEVGKPLSLLVGVDGPGRPLPAREAARLIASVSRGVAAAHARGIVHRDIKPSNIIVTPGGRAMLSDFGLSTPPPDGAHTVPPEATVLPSSARTISGARVTGTPAFMSPEQALGSNPTPASDIYSLGATLRFLLTGQLPFSPTGRYSANAGWDVIQQARRAECPPLLRTRSDVPPDLAAICDRAMAPAPEHRYVSAEAMAADLAAFLGHRPVEAKPAHMPRRAALWARRNPVVVGLVSLIVLGGGAGLWRYFASVGRERDRAVAAEAATAAQLRQTEHARASAQAVNDFLQRIVGAADPAILGQNARILDAVRLVSSQIEPTFRDQPNLEADVRATLGNLYDVLDASPEARRSLSRALELRLATLGPEAPETLNVRHALLKLDCDETHEGSCIDGLSSLLDQMRTSIGPDHPVTLSAELTFVSELAARHRFDEALRLSRHVAAVRAKTDGPDSLATLEALRLEAQIRLFLGEVEEGMRSLQSVLVRYERATGPDSFECARTATELAFCSRMLGRNEDAAAYDLRALAVFMSQLPPAHDEILNAAKVAANTLAVDLNRPQEAIAIFEPIAIRYLARSDRNPSFVATTRSILAMAMLRVGRCAEALELMLEARRGYVELGNGERNPLVRDADKVLGQIYDCMGLNELACTHREASGGGASFPAPRRK